MSPGFCCLPLRAQETTQAVTEDDATPQNPATQNSTRAVIVASDRKKGLEVFKANYDRIDLIVMFVMMPSLSAAEAYLQMSAVRPDVRVIFTTGYTPVAASLISLVE
jgi:DNA-binding NarL/FixJ family response regulator